MRTSSVFGFCFSLGALVFTGCDKSTSGGASPAAAEVAIKDDAGYYKPRANASITKTIPDGTLLGDGRAVEVGYDGSEGDGLSYQLFYVDQRGSVHPMGGGSFDDKGGGVWSVDLFAYNSSASDRPGFIELSTVAGAGLKDGVITGRNVSLAMIPIRFKISE